MVSSCDLCVHLISDYSCFNVQVELASLIVAKKSDINIIFIKKSGLFNYLCIIFIRL